MVESLKKRCVEFFTESSKINGFDDFTAKIVGVLYMEPKEISMEGLADRIGYSLSGVSTALKPLVNMGFVKRIKKPGSRKVFVYMDKNLLGTWHELMTKKYEMILLKAKHTFPEIIGDYKKKPQKNEEKEFKIAEDYYKMILDFEKVMLKFIRMLEALETKRKI